MGNRPRPLPDRDDDITGIQSPGKFVRAEKFDGTWKNDGADQFIYTADSSSFAETDSTDGSIKGGYLTADGVAQVETAIPAAVEIPELELEDPTLDPTASGVFDVLLNQVDEYQALPELDADAAAAGSSDLGGDFFDS